MSTTCSQCGSIELQTSSSQGVCLDGSYHWTKELTCQKGHRRWTVRNKAEYFVKGHEDML